MSTRIADQVAEIAAALKKIEADKVAARSRAAPTPGDPDGASRAERSPGCPEPGFGQPTYNIFGSIAQDDYA